MKLFNGVTGRAMIAGLGLLAAAGMANAYDAETGTIVLSVATSALAEDPGAFAFRLTTPDSLKTGRCNGGGSFSVELNGEADKAMYAALVAASSGGRSVTVNYAIDGGNDCYLAYIDVL